MLLRGVIALLFLPLVLAAEELKPFVITVLDEQTGRGVPLVELKSVSEQRFYSDSNGVIALTDPAMLNRDVFFHISSHGYEFQKDGFGFRGKALSVKPGGSVELKIKRINIAERLYRITGEGIYRDSVIAGRAVPIKEPLLNAQVCGQDSVQMLEYRGKYFWFYGDTNRQSYPLGQFGMSGATSRTRAAGLNPARGIDLDYFVDASGFSRPMCPWGGSDPKWIDRLVVVRDEKGTERLVGRCSRMKSLGEVAERTLVVYDDEKNIFNSTQVLKNDDDFAMSHTLLHKTADGEFVYFTSPYACVRVKADFASFCNPETYESFTCLKAGAQYAKAASVLDRDADGKLIWAWKRAAPVTLERQKELIDAGLIKPAEGWYRLADAESGKPVYAHNGTIQYNAFRKRWVMILNEKMGTSMLGEVWYSEATAPEGPWETARKIVTHDKYTFYNVCHHALLDDDGGRVIFFEGTYTMQFSGTTHATPGYDYNQIMYRLNLSDPRLKLK